VGNGGLSFRNIQSCIKILEQSKNEKTWKLFNSGKIGEDVVFSFLFNKYKYNVASRKQASKVFVETFAKKLKSIPDVIGFHALDKFNPQLEIIIFKAFEKLE
jgi:hypothetical protein